eukprot:3472694-Prymnesium_polylepis.1
MKRCLPVLPGKIDRCTFVNEQPHHTYVSLGGSEPQRCAATPILRVDRCSRHDQTSGDAHHGITHCRYGVQGGKVVSVQLVNAIRHRLQYLVHRRDVSRPDCLVQCRRLEREILRLDPDGCPPGEWTHGHSVSLGIPRRHDHALGAVEVWPALQPG